MTFPKLFDSAGREIHLVFDNQKTLVGYVREAFPTASDSDISERWDGFYVDNFRNKMVASFKSQEAATSAVLQEKLKRSVKNDSQVQN